jgi:hypothetical protein
VKIIENMKYYILLVLFPFLVGCSKCPSPFTFEKFMMNEGDRVRISINGEEHYSNEQENLFFPNDEFEILCESYCPKSPFEVRVQLNAFDTMIQIDHEVIGGLILGVDPQNKPIIIYDSTRPGLLFYNGKPCCFE